MTDHTLDQQRAKFEDWARPRGLSLRRRQQAQDEYDNLGTHDAWAAWQYIESKARADERARIVTVCDELEAIWTAMKDVALLNGDVNLSNARAGLPHAARLLREQILALT